MSAVTACIWTVGPRLLYLCVLSVATKFGGVTLRASRLYIVLPLLFLVAQTIMGVLFLAAQILSEATTTVRRLKVNETSLEEVSYNIVYFDIVAQFSLFLSSELNYCRQTVS